MEGWDPNTKSTLTQIPLLTMKSGPRDGAAWMQRLKEEYKALIAYTQMNKSNDNDWFRISAANAEGTRWTGKCWYVHNLLKYEFDLQFDIPVTYPSTAPELELPQLDGKTQKMYRGGKICLTVHFKPLWAKNCPRFGIAHALCLGLAPWLAAEIPILVDSGLMSSSKMYSVYIVICGFEEYEDPSSFYKQLCASNGHGFLMTCCFPKLNSALEENTDVLWAFDLVALVALFLSSEGQAEATPNLDVARSGCIVGIDPMNLKH